MAYRDYFRIFRKKVRKRPISQPFLADFKRLHRSVNLVITPKTGIFAILRTMATKL
jgi:hypothetical protein